MKRVFKILVKFEQNGKWSERQKDSEGYLVKEDGSDVVIGYVRPTYPNRYGVRFVKGFYRNEKSLVFFQLINDAYLSPICYCFPNVKERGYWSSYNKETGFFSFDEVCSYGRAMIELIEIHNDDVASITSMIFEDNVRQATWDNWCLLREVDQLLGFLEPDMIAHIQEYFEE